MMQSRPHSLGARIACLAALLLAQAGARLLASPMGMQNGSLVTPLNMADLLAGPGVVVVPTTVATAGIALSRGEFSNAGDLIGIASGVVLSTGLVNAVPTPNRIPDSTYSNLASTDNGSPGDADLNLLVSPYLTADASVLSFDIIPTSSVLEFSYVFSSEEYNYYVGDNYNDVFAFYVNGVNVALLPDGETVSIHNVNGGKNSQYFILNETPGTTLFKNFAINGLTVVLTAHAVVTPGVANHIKLAVADTFDALVDSDVFIAAHSMIAPTLTSTSTPTPTITPTYSDTATFSDTPTSTCTGTITITCTPTPTFSSSPTPSDTPSITATFTTSPSFSASPTYSDTPTITATFTTSPSFSASPTYSDTPTATPSFSFSPTPSISPTYSNSPSSTDTPTPTSTSTPTPSCTGTPTCTPSFTITPTSTGTGTPSITATPSATGSPTVSPTQTPRPLILHLYGNSPNPFGGSGTWITYWLQVDAKVNIDVWDVSGEKVRSLPPFAGRSNLVNNGNNETFWDGKNDSGRLVASGVYIYRVRATTARNEEAHDFGKAAVLR